MAGSFSHCDNDGWFTFDRIENMGDAYEACEEMHWMVRALSEGDKERIAWARNSFNQRPPGLPDVAK